MPPPLPTTTREKQYICLTSALQADKKQTKFTSAKFEKKIERKKSSSEPGLLFDSKSAVPDSYFWARTPTFQENLTKVHDGTPTFLKKGPWNSYFENPSENPASYSISRIQRLEDKL